MIRYKELVLNDICYTDLVYERINKKLNRRYSRHEVEEMILETLKDSEETHFRRSGKNIYVTNNDRKIKITINFNTCRVITVDAL
ncbi:DUF3781 domain-containing protein [Marinilabilia salmonicolor]|uniref:DUF3781 domain-containing protein n=1 Tax=Marinilabilia salmonicolor TaxID=989 RepID=UPI00029AC209|nr:DUF3781 domain-containing protein [Marinilabilia salmonicolor]